MVSRYQSPAVSMIATYLYEKIIVWKCGAFGRDEDGIKGQPLGRKNVRIMICCLFRCEARRKLRNTRTTATVPTDRTVVYYVPVVCYSSSFKREESQSVRTYQCHEYDQHIRLQMRCARATVLENINVIYFQCSRDGRCFNITVRCLTKSVTANIWNKEISQQFDCVWHGAALFIIYIRCIWLNAALNLVK